MENNDIILKAVKYIKEDYYDFAIKDLLIEDGVSPDDINDILEEANKIVLEENITKTAKKYKFIFGLNVILIVVTLFCFLTFLPKKIENESVFYPLLGSFLCCFFGYLCIAYYKSWKLNFLRRNETLSINYSFLIIVLLPGLILYFIIASVFKNTAEEILKENQVEVVGTVISGGETEIHSRRGTIKSAVIVVEFETLEGEKIMANKDVSSFEFKDFYYLKEVNLIYSKTNPHNVAILTSESALREFKNSAERDITYHDLENLIDVKEDELKSRLDKIVYGWEYEASTKAWVNNRKNIGVAVHDNSIIYIAPNGAVAHYLLEKEGYEAVNKNDSSFVAKVYGIGQLYKKGNLIATIEMISTKNGEPPMSMTTLRRLKI